MALSPIAAAGMAHPSLLFPGATWAPNASKYYNGCATAKITAPHWTAVSGAGRWKGSTTANTCPAYRGGSAQSSYGDANGGLYVTVPFSEWSHSGGVNVSWALSISAMDAAGVIGGNWNCPSQTYSYSYNYGWTWINTTDTYSYCTAYASWDVYGYTNLVDTTNGSYVYSGNYWSGLYNSSGVYNDTYMYSTTYSNSSYWAYNYSYSGSYNYSYGPGGTFSGLVQPTWFFNSTFVGSHQYEIQTSMYAYCSSDVAGFAHAGAKSAINMQTPLGGHYEDLNTPVLW